MAKPTPKPKDPGSNTLTEEATAKAKAEAQTAEATAAKTKAEAQTAEATAEKTKLELAAQDTPLAKAKLEAEAKKGVAEANQAAASARQKELAALLPDLTNAEGGSLEGKKEDLLFSSALADRALGKAAETAATASLEALEKESSWRVLVTSDAELATSDSVYLDVTTGLKQLNTAAEKIASETKPEGLRATTGFPPLDVAAVLAGAVPAALSLFSANRTLSSTEITVSDLAAAAATAGSLASRAPEGAAVVHDDFRILPSGGTVHAQLAKLDENRQLLVGRKITLADESARTTEAVTRLQEKVKELEKKLEAAKAEDKPALQRELDDEKEALSSRRQSLSEATTRLGLLDSVMTAIETFTTALRTAPAAGSRSPLATATLREQLHAAEGENPAAPRFTHVMLVKAEPGSGHQVIDDRPLWSADKFSAIGIVNLTYMVIETGESAVKAAGSASGKAVATGSIGEEILVEVEE